MFSYDKVKENPTLLVAMTGLMREEFETFLPDFQKAWQESIEENYMNRPGRQRQYGGGKPETSFACVEDKLLFILYYVEVYPLQEILAFEFDISPSTAHEWIHILSGVLKKAREDGRYLPERDPKKLEMVLESEPECDYGIDGTERRRQRP
ncbi:MAG: transposase family protein, partial [Nitrososphaera sp.]|nr:transposase family protein [Nitrososphaera sp.]